MRNFFQGFITPDNSGKLPKKEGTFLYQASFNNNSGGAKTFVLPPLIPADDYFLILFNESFIVTGGNNPFVRAYPPGTNIGVAIDGNDKAAIAISELTFPARLPIPAGWQIISAFINEANGAFGTVTLYGVQLLDCFDNLKALLRSDVM